jgi:hypothetical protein
LIMAASHLDLIVNQIRLLSPDELVKLIKKAAELLEQKQSDIVPKKVDYVSLIGSGKGLFSSPEEVDRFIREERDAWDE